MGKRLKLALAIILVLSTCVLGVVLGTWQVQRLEWKNNIITQLNQAYEAPQQLDSKNIHQLKNPDFIYGTLTGTFDYSKQILMGPTSYNGTIVQRVITPLKIENFTIFVMRGFIAVEDASSLIEPKYNRVSVRGLLREPTWNKFTSNNMPDQDIWTKPDIKEMAEYLKIKNIMPYFLYADYIEPDLNDAVIIPSNKWYPRNKHAQYATFWFSMSVIILLFFGFIFIRQRNIVSN